MQLVLVNAANTPQTLTTGQRANCDVSAGVVTVNAPASPALSNAFGAGNFIGDASANNITVSGNGNNIESPVALGTFAATALINQKGASVDWQYDGTRWKVI